MAKTPKRTNKRVHLSSKDREHFISNLALLLKAGVPIGEALDSLIETSRSKALKTALKQMQHSIDEGLPLWQTLEQSKLASSQTLALVRLGEQSGKLVDNLRMAAKQEEKQRIFRSKVRSALIYPSFVMGLTGIVGLSVAWFLLPRLAATFAQLDVKLPLISRLFVNFGTFLKDNGFWAVPLALLVGSIIMYFLFVYPKTKVAGQWLLFRTPGISKLMYEVEVARLGYLLGTLLQAGLSVTQSLELLGQATTARRYKRFYKYLYDSFENGYSFRTSFAGYKTAGKLVPPAVQQMIIAGERSGALAETLLSVGEIYEEKVDVSTQNLEAVLEPILLIIVWFGVMAVAIAVIVPIYSLVGGLDS